MNRMRNNKYLLMLIGFIAFLVISIFISVIVANDSVLIFPGDSYEQIYQFYLGGWQKFHDFSIAQFEWSLGFGGNMMSYVYYFLTSPFFLLSLLFNEDFIKYSFLYFNMIKMVLLFFACYYWLSKHSSNKSSIIIASLSFTFSGWVFFYLAYNIFLEPLILFPIILGLIDEFTRKKKYLLLCISLGVLGIISYYSLYMFIPFILMYALYQYLIYNRDKINIKSLLIKGLQFILIIIIAVGICAVVLLPMINILKTNPRFTEDGYAFFDHISKFDVFKIFSSLFVPITSRLDPNVLITSSNHSFLGWGGGVGLYMSALLPLSLILYSTSKGDKKKYLTIAFYAIVAMFALFFGFYKLFQLTIDTRWFYMFNILGALVICFSHDSLLNNEYSKKRITIVGMFVLLTYSSLVFMSYINNWGSFDINTIVILLIQGTLIIGYWIYMLFGLKSLFIVLLSGIEVIYVGNLFVYYNWPISSDFFDLKYHDTEAVEWIKNYDDGFYRIMYDGVQDGFDIFTANDPFSKNYNGVAFYSTIYNTNQEGFVNRFKGKWSMPQLRGRVESYNLASAKYWFSYDDGPRAPMRYKLIYDDEFKIFENDNFINLGFGYDKIIGSNQITKMDYIHQDQYILEYMIKDDVTELVELGDNNLKYIGKVGGLSEKRIIELDKTIENTNLYIANFGMPECVVKLYYEDVLVFEQGYWQYNYIDLPLYDMKVDKIEVYNQDFLWNESEIYMYTKEFKDYDLWYESVKERMFTDVEFNGDKISARLDVQRGYNHIYTSIPYDDGWRVYVNGIEIDFYKANLGFIGFDLNEGEYLVEFEYGIPLLIEGAIISVISVSLILGIYIYGKKRIEDDKQY